MDDLLKNFIENFNVESLAAVGQFVVSGGAITWAVGIYNKFKSQAVQTPKQISEQVNNTVKTSVMESLKNTLKPIEEKLAVINNNEKIIAESLALLATGDAESKLALIQNISKIKEINAEIMVEATTTIQEQVAEEVKKEEVVQEAIEKLEEETL